MDPVAWEQDTRARYEASLQKETTKLAKN